ncbi:MAG TPA: cupin domain-containing protein [Chloroflexota bacterium]|nr:cupin domain-containing protein [Chloroflexota bacterium]
MAVDVAALPRIEKINTYKEYQRREGIPVHTGFGVEDIKTVEVGPWARREGRGAFVDLDGNGGINDAYVCEIPPGGHLAPQRQMYEEMIYVVSGNGSTSVWNDAGHKLTFEWKAGSLFCIPLNANHQHFNGSGQNAARFFAVTSAPVVMNLYHNLDFVFNNPYTFEDRFSGQDDYFDGQGKLHYDRVLETNFVPDVNTIELYQWKERGAGGSNVRFEMGHNTMAAHISQFPVGTYKKGHRHGPGAHVIIISGTGYSLLWPDGEERRRFDWKPGGVVVPPRFWFHQHFNSGPEPARYLALRWGSRRYYMSEAFSQGEGKTDIDVKAGGAQIEYQDEARDIHEIFEAELRRHGAPCRMKSMVEWCTSES